jgi:hypothetical protein
MYWMFLSAISFNQDISSWNISNDCLMRGMLKNTSSFNQDISKWNVNHVSKWLYDY